MPKFSFNVPIISFGFIPFVGLHQIRSGPSIRLLLFSGGHLLLENNARAGGGSPIDVTRGTGPVTVVVVV